MLRFSATKATSTCSPIYQGLLSLHLLSPPLVLASRPVGAGGTKGGGLRGVRRAPSLRVLHSLFT